MTGNVILGGFFQKPGLQECPIKIWTVGKYDKVEDNVSTK